MGSANKKISKIVLADLLFVCFLMLSGMLAELSDFFYIAAFLFPALFLILTEKPKTSLAPTLNRGNIPQLLIAAPLIVGGVVLLAFITTSFFSLFGIKDNTELPGNIFSVIVSHALLPALFEELLFRYAPIRMLGDMKRGNVIFLTSALFALAHCDLLKLPYAFFAGIAFAYLDIALASILPSLIIHFTNNLVSVFNIRYSDTVFPTVLYISLAVLSAISIIIILVKRRALKEKFLPVISELELRRPNFSVLFFAAAATAVAVLKIIGG